MLRTGICSLALLFCACAKDPQVVGCQDPPLPTDQGQRVTISNGVWGQVWFWEGDFLPGLCATGSITPVERTVYFYQPAAASDLRLVTVDQNTFIAEVRTALVDSARSDVNGFFQKVLPPGKYSVVIREGTLMYGSEYDSSGHLQALTVPVTGVVKRQLNILYEAYF